MKLLFEVIILFAKHKRIVNAVISQIGYISSRIKEKLFKQSQCPLYKKITCKIVFSKTLFHPLVKTSLLAFIRCLVPRGVFTSGDLYLYLTLSPCPLVCQALPGVTLTISPLLYGYLTLI